MLPERIRELAPLLPDSAPYFKGITFHYLRRLDRASKIAFCLKDPRFPWIFVKTFYDLHKSLPDSVYELAMLQAEEYLWNQPEDPVMDQVMALASPINKLDATIVDAHLVDPAMTLIETSAFLQIPMEVLAIYENLFFSVRDRLEDNLFMATYIFPESRKVELEKNYLKTEHWRPIMLRVAWERGVQDARKWGGFKCIDIKESDAKQTATALEALTLSKALFFARMGGINTHDIPVLRDSMRILQANKLGGQEQGSDDMVAGLGAVSLAYQTDETIKALQAPLIRRRLEATKAHYEEVKAKASAKSN